MKHLQKMLMAAIVSSTFQHFTLKLSKAFIINPTINYKTNTVDQDQVADNIRKSHYESCIPDLQNRYASDGRCNFEVIGL